MSTHAMVENSTKMVRFCKPGKYSNKLNNLTKQILKNPVGQMTKLIIYLEST
jgi:hypothetical protein